MTYETSTSSSGDTQSVAQRLSRLLSGGETIELLSDLGGGKTTFVQGLAKGLGYNGPVTSPTFSLSNEYVLAAHKWLHHYDLYRLGATGVVGSELAEDLIDPDVITVIEWAAIAHDQLPADRITITFEVTGDTERRLRFSSNGPSSDRIIKELAA